MGHRPVGSDRRGVSEMIALVTLVGMVVVTVGAVGAYTLVSDEAGTTDARFAFEYLDDAGSTLITYQAGPELQAGDVVIEGPDNAVTWAELANDAPDEPIGVGDAVQVSGGNVYGSDVLSGDEFRIYRGGENRTEVASWTAGN